MRGRAMIRPLIKAQVASVVIGMGAPFTHGWAEWILWRGGEWLSWASIGGFGVILAWNVLHPDEEARQERLEARREEQRLIMQHAAVAAATGWDRAVLDAQRAGTFSLNGVRQPGTTLRYAGPPALYTPPGGIEVMITIELKASPHVSAMPPCVVCRAPADVRLNVDGAPHLCQRCMREAHALKYLFK